MSFCIVPIPVPASPDEAPSWQIEGFARLSGDIDAECTGIDDFRRPAAMLSAGLCNQTAVRKMRWVVVPQGCADPGADDVIGYAVLNLPIRDNTTTAHCFLGVAADQRGRGIGSTLWDLLVDTALAEGRVRAQSWSSFPREVTEADQVLRPVTGPGFAPVDNATVQFVQRRGGVLHQVERRSQLDLPVEGALLESYAADSAAHSLDYDLVQWADRVPEEWIEAYCRLLEAMSTDAPSGELSLEPQRWDPELVRADEAVFAAGGGQRLVTTAVHRASGDLVGYTVLEVSPTNPQSASQDDTLVLGAHRGHRLGMRLKVANLQALAVSHPQVERIHTWNAGENAPMLSINLALGFVPRSGEAAWEVPLG